MSNYIQSNQIVILPYENSNINIADSGKILILPQTIGGVGITYTLPLPMPGLSYKFINGSFNALVGSITILTNGAQPLYYGTIINGPFEGLQLITMSGEAHIIFAGPGSLLGDFVNIISDGTYWYVEGRSGANLGIA